MKSDLQLEFRLLRSACDGNPQVKGYLLPLLRETHFSSGVTANIFKRIIRIHATTNSMPDWRTLMHDPAIKNNARAAMRESGVKPIKTEALTKAGFATLESLRQVRALFELGAKLEEQLDKDSVDPDVVIAELQNDLSKVRNNASDTLITRIGKDSNVDAVVKRILSGNGKRRIATGIQAFDAKNVGFPADGVVILAANTGGGKSALLDNILHYMAQNGASIGFLPLEMDAEENVTRSMSRVTGQSMSDLIDPLKRISKERRIELRKLYRRYSNAMARRGGSIDVLEPGFAANIENILSYLDPLEYDVIAIDYVGLMDGVTGDDQWKALSNAVAYAKRWASRPNRKTLIIFAAQITEEGYLKQSKAMADHCTNVIRWRVGEEERESGIVVLHQDKCRGGAVFDIPMKVDFEHMLFRDLTKGELEDYQLSTRPDKKGDGTKWKSGGQKKKSTKYATGQGSDDDDEDAPDPIKVKPKRATPRKSRDY